MGPPSNHQAALINLYLEVYVFLYYVHLKVLCPNFSATNKLCSYELLKFRILSLRSQWLND